MCKHLISLLPFSYFFLAFLFLCSTARSAKCVLAIGFVEEFVRSSVHAFVCHSHPAALSKRCKLLSRNLHCQLPERLYSFKFRKAFPEIRKGSPQPRELNERGNGKSLKFKKNRPFILRFPQYV